MTRILAASACVAAAVCIGGIAPHAQQSAQQSSQQTADSVTVNLSDPSRPGTVRVHLKEGGITVKGGNRKDVLVSPGASRAATAARGRGARQARGAGAQTTDDVPPGMKRLTPPVGFSVEERNNEVSIRNGDRGGRAFEIQVPARTNLDLSSYSGPIVVEGVDGEIEIKGYGGSVTLTDVAGAVVSITYSGHLTARLSRVSADKAMSFASYSGNVDVTLPASVKANVKLRSPQGEVYTDFDLQQKPTTGTTTRKGNAFRFDANDAIVGTINGGGPEIELRTYSGRVLLRKGP